MCFVGFWLGVCVFAVSPLFDSCLPPCSFCLITALAFACSHVGPLSSLYYRSIDGRQSFRASTALA